MKSLLHFLLIFLFTYSTSCTGSTAEKKDIKADSAVNKTNTSEPVKEKTMAGAAEIMARKQVPVLCYHRIKDLPVHALSKNGYEVGLEQFKAQMKTLADSGFHSITPEQYYEYLAYGTALPEKPVMITYDDTRIEHFTIAKPEMEKYGFKGVFFIMTISMNRPNYMSKDQIRQLFDDGHVIASHSWDHHRVDRLKGEDFTAQFDKPKKQLEEITGKPIEYFAYPFGIWSPEAIPEIKKRGFKMSYILSTKRDSLEPLQTVRRIIIAPTWTPQGLIRTMKSSF